MVKCKQQLEFVSVSKIGHIAIGASNLINSTNWTGYLWYFPNESDLISGVIDENENSVQYQLSYGVAAGIFLDNDNVLVGNDVGMVAIYGYDKTEKGEEDWAALLYNKESRTEHDSAILSLSTTKTAHKFLSGSMDRCLKLWDTETFTPFVSYDQAHTSYVSFVQFMNTNSSDDKVFISASFDGSVMLWDLRNPDPAEVLIEEFDYRPTHVEWFEDADHLLLVGCDSGTVRLIDRRNTKEPLFVREFSRSRSVNSIRSHLRDSKKYVSICGNTTIMKVYELGEKLREIYSNESHGDYVQDTAWIPQSDMLLSCSWDSKVIKHLPFSTAVNSHGDA